MNKDTIILLVIGLGLAAGAYYLYQKNQQQQQQAQTNATEQGAIVGALAGIPGAGVVGGLVEGLFGN